MSFKGADFFYSDGFMFDEMGIEAIPPVLYHYTSFDSLRKILSTRRLRFSRLDKVNDPEEAVALDVPFASSSVFVSCWSSTEIEQIPLWSMYGANFGGIRMRLPSNMFSGRGKPVVFEKGGAILTVAEEHHIERKPPAMSTNGCGIIGPNKIYYSDDPSFRIPRMVHRDAGYARFVPYDLGMVKSTKWSYEDEWRFKIAAIAFEASFPDDRYFNEVTLNLEAYPVVTEALSIPLDPSALEEMEITIGSKADADTVEGIEHVLGEYAPGATVVRSDIRIR